MIAASFWSLLSPAIELAESSGYYGRFSFIPVALGFLLGAIFVYGTDKIISYLGINSSSMMIALTHSNKDKAEIAMDDQNALEHGAAKPMVVGTLNEHSMTIGMESFADCLSSQHSGSVSRKRKKKDLHNQEQATYENQQQIDLQNQISQWKRIMLLVVAITVHNIPEGLAVGVSFGAIGSTSKATFEAARNLAIGIGIQNFPEGLAVSLPLHSCGFSLGRSFWYGQLSGMVEPIFGGNLFKLESIIRLLMIYFNYLLVLGAVAVTFATIILPYALSFAAGAMI